MQVGSLLHPRCSDQFNIAIVSCISSFIGTTNSASRMSTVRIGPVAHESNIAFCDGFFQALVLSLCNKHCQFVGLQIEYSLAERTVERELIPMAHALGLTVTAWSPLAGGLLTGKYAKGAASGGRFDDPQMAQAFGATDQRRRAIAQAVGEVSKAVGRSSAQVALAWLRQRSTPVIPIIGSRKIDQLKDNIACLDLRLDEAQLKKLEEASAIDLGFPTNFYNVEMVRQVVYGGMRDRIDV